MDTDTSTKPVAQPDETLDRAFAIVTAAHTPYKQRLQKLLDLAMATPLHSGVRQAAFKRACTVKQVAASVSGHLFRIPSWDLVVFLQKHDILLRSLVLDFIDRKSSTVAAYALIASVFHFAWKSVAPSSMNATRDNDAKYDYKFVEYVLRMFTYSAERPMSFSMAMAVLDCDRHLCLHHDLYTEGIEKKSQKSRPAGDDVKMMATVVKVEEGDGDGKFVPATDYKEEDSLSFATHMVNNNNNNNNNNNHNNNNKSSNDSIFSEKEEKILNIEREEEQSKRQRRSRIRPYTPPNILKNRDDTCSNNNFCPGSLKRPAVVRTEADALRLDAIDAICAILMSGDRDDAAVVERIALYLRM
jgi:hypothetical protein